MTPAPLSPGEWLAAVAILVIHAAVLALVGLLRWGARRSMPQPCARPRDANVISFPEENHA